jgi:hypothetical protein
MKLDIEEVESKLLEHKVDPQKVNQIIRDLEKVVEELAEERKASSAPKQKWDHVIVLNDENGLLTGKEITGWVVQKPSEDDPNLILSKLIDAAKNQNEVTRKKANIMSDFRTLFEHLKAKFTKEKNIRIKTKEPVQVLITQGKFV